MLLGVDNDPLVRRFARVPFGLTCGPFLLLEAIRTNLNSSPELQVTHPEVVRRLKAVLLNDVFVESKLPAFIPKAKVPQVTEVFSKFNDLWAHLCLCDREVDCDKISAFIICFRKTYAVGEVCNYIHLLCHFPMLYSRFGHLHECQQQSGEYLNHSLSSAMTRVCQPQTSTVQSMLSVNRLLF